MRKTAIFCLAVLLLSSCGGGDGGGAPEGDASLLTAAREKVTESGSVSMRMTGTVRVDPGIEGQEGIVTSYESEGVTDFSSNRSRITFLVSSEQAQAAGFEFQSCEIVQEGDVAYFSIPEDARDRFENKAWARSTTQAGVTASEFGQDPAASLEYLESVGEEVTEVGQEEVDGVPTTHYRVAVPPERIVENAPEDQREEVRTSFAQLGVESVPIDAWVDEDGFVRRLRIVMEPSGGEEGLRFSSEVDVSFSEFGEAADVEVPAPSEVTEAEFAEAVSACQGVSAPGAAGPGL